MADDRLYFRQLLSGRDFARSDPMARQMVNFVYLIGDRETGEALVVDPAYDIPGILEVLASDDMRCVGALAEGFVTAAAVLRHLQADPLIPDQLLPAGWPGPRLREEYDRYDAAYRAVLADWFAEA